MPDKLLTTREGALERWIINDPPRRNALNDQIVSALTRACRDAADDDTLRVIVLTGAGGSFCSGGSLDGFAQLVGHPLPEGETDPLLEMSMRFGDLLRALCALPQVFIVAVDGPAMGGGFGIACCADFCIANHRALFGTPEVTLGIVPAQIAPVVWRRLGDRTARQLLLQGGHFSAAEAQAMGLVDQLADDVLAAADDLIHRLTLAEPAALAATKHLLNRISTDAMPDLRAEAAQAFASSLRTPQALHGLHAFAEKRKPGWAA
jgi:isohexenylglutaconyl-CoA hydratase